MIYLKLKVIEPLHLASSHSIGPVMTTLDYIPGTAFRGALAAAYQAQNGIDATFQEWFLKEGVRFGPFYPIGRPSEGEIESYVLPATSVTCKLAPGFQGEASSHGIWDQLLEFIQTRQNGDYLPHSNCPRQDCTALLIPEHGFYRKTRLYVPKKRMVTRSALDSRSESAAAEQLFSLEVIEEEECFSGWIDLSEKYKEADLLNNYLQVGKVYRLGSGRTRGQGKIEILEAVLGRPSRLLGTEENLEGGIK